MNTNIDELIALAKAKMAADSRHRNKGRPRTGIPANEVAIISKMRQRGIALRNIHEVMKEKSLARYNNYGTFNAAWKSHLAEKN